MNRTDLQNLAEDRLGDAEALLASDHCGGAYYIVGYAVECGLKACIAKLTIAEDFYDKTLARNIFIHEIEKLAGLAGLDVKQIGKEDPIFAANWALVKDWDAEPL
jgi:hypothetical protein